MQEKKVYFYLRKIVNVHEKFGRFVTCSLEFNWVCNLHNKLSTNM